MIKAQGIVDGKPVFTFALCEQNLSRIEALHAMPIDGRDVQVPGAVIVIAYVPEGKIVDVRMLRDMLRLDDDVKLCVLGLDRDAIDALRQSGIIISDDGGGLPGPVWIVYGETEDDMVAAFQALVSDKQRDIALPERGERIAVDMDTGHVERAPEFGHEGGLLEAARRDGVVRKDDGTDVH